MLRKIYVTILLFILAVLFGASSLFGSTELSVQSYANLVRFAAEGDFSVKVTDLAGKEIFTSNAKNALDWNTANTPNGVYLYTANGKIGKIAVIRGRGTLAPSISDLSIGQIARPTHSGSWDVDHTTNAYTINASVVGIGTNTPSTSYMLDVVGLGIRAKRVGGDGVFNALVSQSDNTFAPAKMDFYRSNEANTATPNNTNIAQFRFTGNTTTGGFYIGGSIVASGGTNSTNGFPMDWVFRTNPADGGGEKDRLTILNSGTIYTNTNGGNFGINTSGPDAKLDVLSTSGEIARLTYTDGSVYTSLNTNSSGYFTVTPSGGRTEIVGDIKLKNAGNRIIFYDGSTMETAYTGSANAVSSATDATITGDSDANASGAIEFKIGAATKAYIKNNGYLGVGTTTPDALLDVEGVMRLTNSTGNAELSSNSSGHLYINPSGGRTGIGTSSPANVTLEVSHQGAVPQFRVSYNATNYADFSVDSSGNLGIATNGGKVGIGTASPTAPLEIYGSSPELVLNGSTTGDASIKLNVASDLELNASGDDITFFDSVFVSGLDSVSTTYNTRFANGSGNNLVAIRNGESASNPIMAVGDVSGISSPSATLAVKTSSGSSNSGLYVRGGTGDHAAKFYGYSTTSTDYVALFKSQDVGSVIELECTGLSTTCDYFIRAYDVNSANTKFKVERDGDTFADGTSYAASHTTGSADLAEKFDSAELLEPGDVVVIDLNSKEQFKKSDKAYDKMVAGIVSTAPGMTLNYKWKGDIMEADAESADSLKDDRPALALAGRVPVKITGIVNAGDLLTTSDVPGHAMACQDYTQCAGAIIGKALESGSGGTIIALVSLQ